MSTLYYQGIHLEVVRTVEYSRRAEYDDASSYLFTRHRIHVQCIFNPQATSYAGPVGTESPSPGSSPAFTDGLIRHYLMQPRGKLIYTSAGPGAVPGALPALGIDGLGGGGGGLVILDTPPSTFVPPNFTPDASRDDYLRDCANGPTPIAINVRQVGLKTWRVEYIIEACVNECFNYYNSPAVLLSHRWRQSHHIDRHGFLVRRVEGQCIFRSDVLGNRVNPDDFRHVLFHPIPADCERQDVRVTADADPTRYSYGLLDRQVSHNILPKNVARLEAHAVVRRGDASILAGGLGGSIGGLGKGLKSDPSPIGGFLGQLNGLLGAPLGSIPQISCTVTVRCWGNRLATREELRDVCVQVLNDKLPNVVKIFWGVNVSPFSVNSEAIQDLMGRYFEMRRTLTAALTKSVSGDLGPVTDTDTLFPRLVVMNIKNVATTESTDGRMAVRDDPLQPNTRNRCRGTFLGACISAALATPCRTPGEPFDQKAKASQMPVQGL